MIIFLSFISNIDITNYLNNFMDLSTHTIQSVSKSVSKSG